MKQHQQLSPEKYIKTKARSLKIGKCWINNTWKKDGMANILITREHTTGNYTCGIFLIDLFALGLKDSYYFFNLKNENFEEKFFKTNSFNLEIDYELAHNIIWGSIEYASDYGLKADKSFETTQFILQEDTDEIPLIEIEFGKNGKPLILCKEGDNKSNRAYLHFKSTLRDDEFNYLMQMH